MSKKENLKFKKDRSRLIKGRNRASREHKLYMKTNYEETVEYVVDCFLKECY